MPASNNESVNLGVASRLQSDSIFAPPDVVDVERRFAGLARLYGDAGAAQIRSAHVAVVGIGGVGSWVAEALARSGVGALTLIDMDHVAESNVNRQVHADTLSIGKAKITAMAERIRLINPLCKLHLLDAFVEPDTWPGLLPNGVDAVVDACDQVRVKTAMATWARHNSTLFITVGAAGGKRHAHLVNIEDLARVTHDPLLAQVRYQLRRNFGAPKNSKTIGLACVYSSEPVVQSQATCDIQSDGTLNCHGYGSLVSVTGSFGFCAAGWVLDKISSLSLDKSKK